MMSASSFWPWSWSWSSSLSPSALKSLLSSQLFEAVTHGVSQAFRAFVGHVLKLHSRFHALRDFVSRDLRDVRVIIIALSWDIN